MCIEYIYQSAVSCGFTDFLNKKLENSLDTLCGCNIQIYMYYINYV